MGEATILVAVGAAVALAAWMVNDWQTQGGVYSAGRNAHGDITVIAPGHQLSDTQTFVAGTDECPKQRNLGAALFGQSVADRKDCIVLSHDRNAVAVTVKDKSGEARETWAVRWQGAEAQLFRPNGDLVRLVAAN